MVLRLAMVGLVLGGLGCAQQKEAPQNSNAQGERLTSLTKAGPYTARIVVEPGEAQVADPIKLTLGIKAPADADVQVTMPSVAKELKELAVREEGTLRVEDLEGNRIWRQTWIVDSNLSGARQIPALTFRVGDQELTTDPLEITVVSSLGEPDATDPTRFADIEGPLTIERPFPWLKVAVVAAGALLIMAVVAVWLNRRRRLAALRAARPLPPHVWALAELNGLRQDRLIEQNRVQVFFYRLSDIVRTYIERRFGLLAPERTTEEFLRELQRSDALSHRHKDLLGAFLTACDLVKFARHEPTGEETDGSLQAAERFVKETIPSAGATAAPQEAAA